MKIDSLEIISLAVPLRRAVKTGYGKLSDIKSIIVKIHTDEGIYGLGESSPSHQFSEETSGSITYTLKNYIAPVILGADPLKHTILMAAVDKCVKGNPFAKAIIDTALLDLCARHRGVPVHDFLGGAFRTKVPLSWSLSTSNLRLDLEEAEQRIGEGFFIFKIKAGALTVKEDIDRACEIRKSLGPDVSIRVDANQAWRFDQAKVALRGMDSLGIGFVEQPLAARDYRGMALLRQMTAIPILADESVFTCQDVMRIAEEASADIVGLKIQKHGGISGSLRVASIARAAGMACYIGSRIGLQVSSAASLHLGALLPDLEYGCEEYSQILLEQPVIETPLVVRDGFIEVPTGPGLGVDLDEAAVRKYQNSREWVKPE